MGKKVALFYHGSNKTNELKINEQSALGKLMLPKLAALFEFAAFTLVDHIALLTDSIKEGKTLLRYRKKCSTNASFYVNTHLFGVGDRLNNRRMIVGTIGVLEPVKGIIKFVEAMPNLLRTIPGIEFIIGGQGSEYKHIQELVNELDIAGSVRLTGWLTPDEVAYYMKQMRLFVLPSYQEGLPTVVLEAMACGTPVLATSVGGIRDIIRDGETGFIMNDNSTECIINNTLRAIQFQNSDQIVQSARLLIENNFTFDKAAERYAHILSKLRL
jgi:glycosyltransferase involved in cell wall biosynthesis